MTAAAGCPRRLYACSIFGPTTTGVALPSICRFSTWGMTYALHDGPLMKNNAIIFSFERCPVLFLIEIRVVIGVLLHELPLLVAFSLGHLKVKLIFVFEGGLLPELVDHVLLLVVVLRAGLVVLPLLEHAEMRPRLWLRPLPVFSLGNAVLEC